MFVDRLYFPVTTLGPGERVAVWTRGCSKQCPGCANPELWETRPNTGIAPEQMASVLMDTARRKGAHRITFTGGDPLEQADELATVLAAIRPVFDDILVYTGSKVVLPEETVGVTWAPNTLGSSNLASGKHPEASASVKPVNATYTTQATEIPFFLPSSLLPLIDVLIDGPYVEALNDGVCGLRGSTNQRVIVLNPALEKLYHDEMLKPRRVQNAVFNGRAMSIGIHGRPHGEERP